jgi:peptidoglycan biosynthesis protein MviN/MurJ (putative lipid II flippase)
MLSVGAFVLAAKLVAASKEIAVAWRYGVSDTVDAYLLAFTIATWLPTMLWSVSTVVLVPRLVGLDSTSGRGRFIAELNGTTLLLGVAATLVVLLVGPLAANLIAHQLEASTQALARSIAWQLAPLAVLTVGAGFLSIRLQSREKHGYAFLEAMPAAGILTLVLLSPDSWGVAPLVWGTLAGAALQTLLLARMTAAAEGGLGGVALKHQSPHWRTIYAALGITAVGQAIMSFTTPIDQVFAAQAGNHAIAILGYTNRIIALATGLGAVTIARAALPVLAAATAREGASASRRHALKWSWLMLAAGSLAAAVGWLLAPWCVALLFERGAFTADDTAVVASALRIGLWQLPFYFAGVVLVQWLAAVKRFALIVWASAAGIMTKLATALVLVPTIGLAGVLWSTVAMYATTLLVCYLVMRRLQSTAEDRR